MQLRAIGRVMARVGTASIVAGSALGLSAAGAQAAPASVTNHEITGIETAISCLTSSRCVAVGYGTRYAQVVALHDGKQGHVSPVKAAEDMESVSCPSSSGCWALGLQKNGAGVVLAKVGSSGTVTKPVKVRVPAGVTLSQISCVSMTSCEVAGTDLLVSPFALEVGSWNGKKLTLHRVAGQAGTTDLSVDGISCWRSVCAAAGWTEVSGAIDGFVLTISSGKPGKYHRKGGDYFNGVSCVSTSRCYVAGLTDSDSGIVVTVTRGVPGFVQNESPPLYGIECAGATCRAAGKELGGSGYYGVVETLSGGKAKGTAYVDSALDGFDWSTSMARRGDGYAAVGEAFRGGDSEVVTG